jgi:hypothetical protein
MSIIHRALVALLLGTLLGGAAVAGEPDRRGLGLALAKALHAKRTAQKAEPALTPRTHTTDFAGEDLGCIILPRREIRPYGYPGHAFLCEEAVSGETLGAVLNKKGFQLCDIYGFYVEGTDCYDFDICGYAERLCVF